MEFQSARFIKANIPFQTAYSETNPAPMFRRKFIYKRSKEVWLHLCTLGFGYCWINGNKISEDLFTAPVSDYNKTLWFNSYNVTKLLIEGVNVVAVFCGNGWYNETFDTPWKHNLAPWRDNPKFILNLVSDKKSILCSDHSWKVSNQSPVIFNQLRSGEYFDSRLYDPTWNTIQYDDSQWSYAIEDNTPPKGQFRKFQCQSVKEMRFFPAISIHKNGSEKYIFDIGQNISGYVRLNTQQDTGDVITIRYAEQINSDFSLQLNNMDSFFPQSPFQTDRFICNGERNIWSPRFAYHGFRYVELTGIKTPTLDTISGVFVHLDVDSLTDFNCSDEYLNTLFRLGKMATLSNLHYIPTDCPTREKLGWANDVQASAEQMLMNFDTISFFRKWLIDIHDSMNEEGAIPGIIPSSGWGYEWGTGPVSSGVLFEVPYKAFLYSGDDSLLRDSFPFFLRHLAYLKSMADEDGLIGFGLCDWAGPFESLESAPTPVKFTDSILYIKFLKIAIFAAERFEADSDLNELKRELNRFSNLFTHKYITEDGTCTVDEQTAVAMLIYFGLYDRLDPLAHQLNKLVERQNFHHHCGMVGLRHLYYALNICGFSESAYKIITSSGFPSYRDWVDQGATTLWETWQPGNSKNHHMYSDFMLWLMKTLVGISPTIDEPGFKTVIISPSFIPGITFCSGWRKTEMGKIKVKWERSGGKVTLRISIPEETKGVWRGRTLKPGEYCFECGE